MVQTTSLYHDSRDLWSLKTVTLRPDIQLLNFRRQDTSA